MPFRVKSKSTGSYFGSYQSKSAADVDADMANADQKNGQTDWESEEKTEKAPPMSVDFREGYIHGYNDGKNGKPRMV